MTISPELYDIHIHHDRQTQLPLTFLVSCLGISKTASMDSNSCLQVNFFQEPEKFWTKSALTLWKRFSGTESTDWTDASQHCSKWKVRGMK
jgi:hypothetical protein